jgi:hypothetical protein
MKRNHQKKYNIMKIKKVFKIFGLAMIVGLAGYNVNLALNTNESCDAKIKNAEALADNENGESGTSTDSVVCYNTYSECWFWACSYIWRCSGINCYNQKCDEQSDKGSCHVLH